MKGLFFITLCFLSVISFGQEARIKPNKKATLRDSITKCSYVLDASHKYIKAYNKNGQNLWTFSTGINSYEERPRERGMWEFYPVSNDKGKDEAVEIHYMMLGNLPERYITSKHRKEEKVIFIAHTGCSGFIYLNNGDYHWEGCD